MVMERRPLYGGDRGLRKRSDNIKTQLRVFAKSDFMHDFGENVDTRDKYTPDDLQRFVEIAQRYNLSKTKALIAGFNKVINSNPYKLLAPTISSIYPEPIPNPAEFVNEEKVLEYQGINYASIKKAIQTDKKARSEQDRFINPKEEDNIVVKGDDEPRSYRLTAVPMKINGNTANIASSFYSLSKKKTNFALIIDAAGGLSLTSIKKKLPGFLESEKFTFYIIENIENDSDSATKLKHIDKQDGSNVEIRYLRDKTQSVVYPPFNLIEGVTQSENLYGNARLILSRTSNEDTEADFIYPDGKEFHIPNVSQNANVKNASLNLLAAGLAGQQQEAHLYPYLKRVGDWCQALSLLDTARVYEVLDENHNPTGKEVTLKQLEENDVEVALVTLDRILLAYALNLGVNVFFTSGSDITSLLYFKNNEIQLTPEMLNTKIAELITQYNAEKQNFKPSTIIQDITNILPSISSIPDDVQYLRALRSFLSNVSMMRFEFDSLTALMNEKDAAIKLENVNSPKLKQLYTDVVSFAKKYSTDNVHNQTLLKSISEGNYPDFPEESEYYTLLASARPSRNAISKMSSIISTKMYSDAEQVKKIFDRFNIQGFTGLFRGPTTLVDVFKGFKPYPAIFSMKGGGRAEINDIYESLRTFEVVPISKQEFDRLASFPDGPQPVISSFSYERGSPSRYMYRDESMIPYTVCDNFIVTSERMDLLPIVASQNTPDVDQMKLAYITLRLLILQNDLLQSRYEMIRNNDEIVDVLDENSMKIGVQESDVNYTEHKHLLVECQKFFDIVADLRRTNDFSTALIRMNQLRIDKTKWTNDTVDLFLSDVRYGGPLRNHDFTRTFNKIRETQDLLLKYFAASGGSRRKTRRARKSKTRRSTA